MMQPCNPHQPREAVIRAFQEMESQRKKNRNEARTAEESSVQPKAVVSPDVCDEPNPAPDKHRYAAIATMSCFVLGTTMALLANLPYFLNKTSLSAKSIPQVANPDKKLANEPELIREQNERIAELRIENLSLQGKNEALRQMLKVLTEGNEESAQEIIANQRVHSPSR